MDMYATLASKAQDLRQLERYIKFIKSRTTQPGILERHHICPRSNDLFPQFSSFKKHPWNRIDLTPREHFIAHLLLWKAFGKSQASAFWLMSNNAGAKSSSRLYASLKVEHRENMIDRARKVSPVKIVRKKVPLISASKVGKKRKPFSEEHKAAMKEAQQRRRLREADILNIS